MRRADDSADVCHVISSAVILFVRAEFLLAVSVSQCEVDIEPGGFEIVRVLAEPYVFREVKVILQGESFDIIQLQQVGAA